MACKTTNSDFHKENRSSILKDLSSAIPIGNNAKETPSRGIRADQPTVEQYVSGASWTTSGHAQESLTGEGR